MKHKNIFEITVYPVLTNYDEEDQAFAKERLQQLIVNTINWDGIVEFFVNPTLSKDFPIWIYSEFVLTITNSLLLIPKNLVLSDLNWAEIKEPSLVAVISIIKYAEKSIELINQGFCTKVNQELSQVKTITYRQLLEELLNCTQIQLDDTVTVYDVEADEFYPVAKIDANEDADDILDKSHLYLRIKNFTEELDS